MRELGTLHFKVGDQRRTIQTKHFAKFHDGFSFCVDTELEAFQAAHLYQLLRTTVRPAAPGYGWLVQVFNKSTSDQEATA